MANRNSNKFVPFSAAAQKFRSFGEQSETTNIDPDLLPEDPIDYESIIEGLKKENAKLHRDLFEAQMASKKTDKAMKEQEKNFAGLQKEMEASVQAWYQEVREHCGQGLVYALTQILQMKDVMDLALINRISEAMSELSAKKKIRVHVSPSQLACAQQMLASHERWSIVADESVESGALFKSEQGEWDTTLEIAVNETMAIIQAWMKENENVQS